jgi:hypothetical protein
MKGIISATLSEEAFAIRETWPAQEKSRILSELIVRENHHRTIAKDLKDGIDERNEVISSLIVRLMLKEGRTPLLDRANNHLLNTLHYQYWN